ncbi:hypothetical protein Lal_00000894 [Lupinus albus]|nr:hypothetical protein Lal_00000894 [Lupinus albus]
MGYNVHRGIEGNHRARLYVLMLMLAFGAALLGTMMLHQFREKSVYNLVVKDKENELLSLQLLLQNEMKMLQGWGNNLGKVGLEKVTANRRIAAQDRNEEMD